MKALLALVCRVAQLIGAQYVTAIEQDDASVYVTWDHSRRLRIDRRALQDADPEIMALACAQAVEYGLEVARDNHSSAY